MRNLKVTFDVVSVTHPDTTSPIIRYYKDTKEAVYDIIHDYLVLFFKIKGVGYIDLKITADKGYFSKLSMVAIRDIIANKILSMADGDIPPSTLQKQILLDTLNELRPKN